MDLRETIAGPIRRHPWETARARYFRKILQTLPGLRPGSVLDVGAGDGWLAEQLCRQFPDARLTCWDSAYGPHATTRASRHPNGHAVTYTAARPAGRFDLLLLMDLLEHIDDDREFISSLVSRNASDGAVFLVCVPAWGALYTSHDATFTHYRRYAPSELSALLRGAGLDILSRGDIFHALLFPRLIRVLWETVTGNTHTTRTPKPLDWPYGNATARLVEAFLDTESAAGDALFRAGMRLPGLSTWALCRKRGRET